MEKLSLSLENYLYTIFLIEKENSKVTPKAVGEALGFNKASTLEAIKNLQNKKMTEYIPHRGVKLTDEGRKYANKIKERKETIKSFLRDFLLISEEDLENSTKTFEGGLNECLEERIKLFVSFSEFCPNKNSGWFKGVKSYVEEGEITELCASYLENSENVL